MTQHIRKALFGYHAEEVRRHIRTLKFHRDNELSELRQSIAKAQQEHNKLKGILESATLVQDKMPDNTNEEIAATLSIEINEFEAIDKNVDINETDAIEEAEIIEEADEVEAVDEPNFTKSSRMGKLLMFRRKFDAPLDPADKHEQSELQVPLEASGYWEAIDQYMTSPPASDELPVAQTIIQSLAQSQAANNSAVGLPRYFDYNLIEIQEQVGSGYTQTRERNVRSKSIEKEDAISAPPVASPEATQTLPTGSKEISREVKQLRYKYIVGKWAGEDLFTREGRLIIAKNSPITEEVVDLADRAGMLAMLIVHMVIPGLGEDV